MPEQHFEAFRENLALVIVGSAVTILASLAALFYGIAAWRATSRGTRDPGPYARWAMRLGGVVVLWGVIGSVSGVLHTCAAVQAQGLSMSDKERIRANGTVQALYNAMFGLVLGGPGLVLGILTSRRRRRPSN